MPRGRSQVMLGSQGVTALIGVVIAILGYFWIPNQWQLYVYVTAGAQLLLLFPLLAWRMPESPRWLEAHGRHEEAERVMVRMEERSRRATGKPLREPDDRPHPVVLAAHKGLRAYRDLFQDPKLRGRLIVLLISWFFGYGGIVYGVGAFAAVYMVDHGTTAHYVFALFIVVGLARFLAFLANGALRERFERSDVIVVVASIFTLAWFLMFLFPNLTSMAVLYTIGGIGGTLWLFNMYNYTSLCFPTRIRAIAFGATDGLGHIGSWLAISFMGFFYLMGRSHLGWILFITLPGAMLPALLIHSYRVRQRAAVMEQLAV